MLAVFRYNKLHIIITPPSLRSIKSVVRMFDIRTHFTDCHQMSHNGCCDKVMRKYFNLKQLRCSQCSLWVKPESFLPNSHNGCLRQVFSWILCLNFVTYRDNSVCDRVTFVTPGTLQPLLLQGRVSTDQSEASSRPGGPIRGEDWLIVARPGQ